MPTDTVIRLLAGVGFVVYAVAGIIYYRQPAAARAHSTVPVLLTVPTLIVLALYLLAALVGSYVNWLR